MHTIRLRHPWEKKQLGQETTNRVDVPEPVSEPAPDQHPAGTSFQYLRRFRRPTGLDQSATVRLCVTGWSGQLDWLSINGHTVDDNRCPITIDVTERLQPQNQIQIQLTATTHQPALLSGEVKLQIVP